MKILFRPDRDTEHELKVCQEIFGDDVITSRTDPTLKNELVFARYSALPYFKELVQDLANTGCTLINNHRQHQFIADFEYYHSIKPFTPKTYFMNWHEMPEGRYVVKGKTNSRKFDWNTRMFADTKRRAIEIACDLMSDALISTQDIIIREFVDLENFGYGVNGIPFSNEFRFFFLKENMLSFGYYWSISDVQGHMDVEGIQFAKRIAKILSQYVNFFVIDIARQTNGKWIVVEVNDGMCSGLSMNDPKELYDNMKFYAKLL